MSCLLSVFYFCICPFFELLVLPPLQALPAIRTPTHSKGRSLDLVISKGLQTSELVVNDVAFSHHCCVWFKVCVPGHSATLSHAQPRLRLLLTTLWIISALKPKPSLMPQAQSRPKLSVVGEKQQEHRLGKSSKEKVQTVRTQVVKN